MTATITIDRVTVPESVDSPDAGDYLAMSSIINRSLRHDLGSDHLCTLPGEFLPGWQDQTYRLHRGYLARRGGVAVGALQFTASLDEGARDLEFDLMVLPEARDTGVEDALLNTLRDVAAELGRTSLQTFSLHPLGHPGEWLKAPTGYGAVPVDDQTVLWQRAGFTLKQVERNSAFDLRSDAAPIQQLLDDAVRFAGGDYRVVTWGLPTPDEHVEGFAWVLSRMSTDVPLAGMDVTEEHWDAERVRSRDRKLQAGGFTVSVAAVVHEPSGTIVAYNELGIGEDHEKPTTQWGTLVTREHRGHRLGTVVKCANLLRWRELVPESPFVSTFNAEENRPMLDVNEAIGFTPLAVAGAWEKILS